MNTVLETLRHGVGDDKPVEFLREVSGIIHSIYSSKIVCIYIVYSIVITHCIQYCYTCK